MLVGRLVNIAMTIGGEIMRPYLQAALGPCVSNGGPYHALLTAAIVVAAELCCVGVDLFHHQIRVTCIDRDCCK